MVQVCLLWCIKLINSSARNNISTKLFLWMINWWEKWKIRRRIYFCSSNSLSIWAFILTRESSPRNGVRSLMLSILCDVEVRWSLFHIIFLQFRRLHLNQNGVSDLRWIVEIKCFIVPSIFRRWKFAYSVNAGSVV